MFVSISCPTCLDFAGADGCFGGLDLIPGAIIVGLEVEACGMAVAAAEHAT